MRIIGGRLGGKTINPPAGYAARPTTDFAREGLFNVLGNEYEFEDLKVLDLFGGTGAGAGMITAVELVTGLLVNRDFGVWDYRGQPGNIFGQICPVFMALWVPVGAAGMALYGWAEGMLDRVKKAGQ